MLTPRSFTPPTTADQLKAASLSQLKHWARLINDQSTTSGSAKAIKRLSLNKEGLCQALADHLKIDLTTSAAGHQPEDVKPTLSSTDQLIFKRQYDYMLALYNEWDHQEDFRFSSSDVMDPEGVDARALERAAQLSGSSILSPQVLPALSMPGTSSQVSHALDMNVGGLDKATSLMNIIQKCTSGELTAFADSIAGTPEYKHHKNTINRYWRIFKVYQNNFAGDIDHFTSFFKKPVELVNQPRPGGYRSNSTDGLFSSYEVGDDFIKLCTETINKEKEKPVHIEAGKWEEIWGGLNNFEIMEALWKQLIKRERLDEKYYKDGQFSEETWKSTFPSSHWYITGKKIVKMQK